MAKFLRYVSYVKRIMPYFLYFLPAFLYSLHIRRKDEYKEVWLISERGDEARDNGFHLFKYIKENYPNINVYFVITNESPDFYKIEKYNTYVENCSFMHYTLFILAKKLISTHLYGAAPHGKACLPWLKLLPKKHHIFLQHGIIKDKFSLDDKNLDLFICSSKSEISNLESCSKRVKKAIRLLGLCRYDTLIDISRSQPKKRILVMPTFRNWLEDIGRTRNSDARFRQDPFYSQWNSLLMNNKLNLLLKEHDIELIFYPHYRIQKFLHNFKAMSDNIILANNRMYDIQELLTISSLLITDYSSVFFDFAYMNKPQIFFQFDLEKYRSTHYKQGSFIYEKHAFGPVFHKVEDVVDQIELEILKDFNLEPGYRKRIDEFFEFRDHQNTERNFLAIMKIGKEIL